MHIGVMIIYSHMIKDPNITKLHVHATHAIMHLASKGMKSNQAQRTPDNNCSNLTAQRIKRIEIATLCEAIIATLCDQQTYCLTARRQCVHVRLSALA